ncbi:helix-turn-helix domain-containing protein [Sphingomonas soli]|uniref:helix-turn-helix domain-containing protein n=1 Tax=Sphingomonas soli TaxID=266127 RepID=UPI00082CE218|nr:helix-turn-helix domain-containing protein [Sphingomonas soli]
MSDEVPIRSISRALRVLQVINRGRSLTLTQISRGTSLPYPTVARLVQTLLHEGMLEREPGRKRYRPTAMVQTLSHGFQGHGRLVRAARPHIVELTKALGWPVTLAVHVGHRMVVQDSTHALTSLTFNHYYPGYAMPLLGSAAGKVFLAFTDRTERDLIIETLSRLPPEQGADKLTIQRFAELLDTILRQGYATGVRNIFTENPGKTSSIAVPIIVDGKVTGTLTLAFFQAAMALPEAVQQYLGPLYECARRTIETLATIEDLPDQG